MAYTTINKSTDYFNTKLYTGNGGTQSLTGVGFQPDFTWVKGRSVAEHHNLYDAVRGVTKPLYTNLDYGEGSASDSLTAFNSDGFSIGANAYINTNNATFASWNWKANGAGSANTAGSVNSTVSVNSTAGFSIVKYVGDGAATTTVGHGLGVVPQVILIKNLETATNWTMYHHSMGNTGQLYLDTTTSFTTDADTFKNTTPTNTLWTMSNSAKTNQGSRNHIAYCFAEKTGYSKFGKYYGNGNANGKFIYTGFKPRFFISKRTDSADNWSVWDSARDTFNEGGYVMEPDSSSAEWNDANFKIDFVSNGVKIRNAWTQNNNGSGTYIFMAFGQSLVGSNNVPCTAR